MRKKGKTIVLDTSCTVRKEPDCQSIPRMRKRTRGSLRQGGRGFRRKAGVRDRRRKENLTGLSGQGSQLESFRRETGKLRARALKEDRFRKEGEERNDGNRGEESSRVTAGIAMALKKSNRERGKEDEPPCFPDGSIKMEPYNRRLESRKR